MKKFFAILSILFNVAFVFSQQKSPVFISQWIVEPEKNLNEYPLIYLDFWATWCAPCISSMPYTEQLEQKYGDQVLFLYISQEPPSKVQNFMQKRNKDFVSAIDLKGKTFDAFNIHSIPQSYILGPGGEIVWKGRPLELNNAVLDGLLYQYGNKKIKKDRIVKKDVATEASKWNVYKTSDGKELKYMNIAEDRRMFVQENGEFYLSGTLPYVVAVIKDVPLPMIKTTGDKWPPYRFSAKAEDKETFDAMVEEFIDDKTPYSIRPYQEKKEVYVLKDKKDQSLFSDKMYNFEKGDNVPLIDEFGMMIDNATKRQMTEWLTQTTGQIFLYEGNDDKKYDWNIYYPDFNELLRILENELGFEVEKTEKKLTFYELQ